MAELQILNSLSRVLLCDPATRRSLPSCEEVIVVSPSPVYHLLEQRQKGKFGSHFLMIVK